MTNIKSKQIQQVVQKIVKEYQPEKIILFGSYAWGKPNEDSDVDLFIIKNSNKNRRDRQRELRLKLFPPTMPLDLLVYTPEETKRRLEMEDFFINDILYKGKVLYETTS